MKNRLIYLLITLMLVSLVGIIGIQGVWISSSIDERRKEFAVHTNDALNKVNDAIDDDEAVFIIENQFGGLDSLVRNVVIAHDNGHEHPAHVIIDELHNNKDVSIQYKIDSGEEELIRIEELEEPINQHINKLEESARRLEIKLEGLDSVLEAKAELHGVGLEKIDKISNIVEHFTFESFLSGEIKDRITYDKLNSKLETALHDEGIYSEYEFGVYNVGSEKYEEDYISESFDPKRKTEQYRKQLFQNDRSNKKDYELVVQFGNQSTYIWEGVGQMVALSIVFTILILLSFGYALYFIFKQKKISQIKNDFINNMTHELKTPLASISLATSSIKHPEIIGKSDEINHYLEIIESEKERINSHIEKVLDIAALDKSELQLNFEDADFIAIVHKSLKNVDLSINDSNGDVSFDTDLSSATISCDQFHLNNAITNILDNSIKYKRDELKIRVNLISKGDDFVLSIADNGIGMTSGNQKKAFDKFFRAESGNIHNVKGFGLGLSYVKSIVEEHNGRVSISSDIGVGTTVTISIPKK